MAKYAYDKSALKGLGVGAFLGQVKLREQKINEADDSPSPSIFNANNLATSLHPYVQNVKVKKIIDHGTAKQYVLGADIEAGTKKLAYFRAGQYISIVFEFEDRITCRPYTIMSNPKDALSDNSTYSILVKPVEGGEISNYINQNWQVGTKILISSPLGKYFYTSLRDAKHVVACAGGSGITPFSSMAYAIDSGAENFKLTILYGNNTRDEILLKEELEALEKRNPDKIKIVHVLAEEKVKGYEAGFINADIIQKYAGDGDYSVFACGPKPMMMAVMKATSELGLPHRRARFEVPGEIVDAKLLPNFKESSKGATHKVTVYFHDEVQSFEIEETKPILRGLEEQNFKVLSDCRCGVCGYCRCRLINGDVFMPVDNRRRADAKFG